ncbi:MAG: hypothetical protein QG635_107 [Bacteroidota bacterium]|nr:hypothetical protein [Bacteroidota bacterium]
MRRFLIIMSVMIILCFASGISQKYADKPYSPRMQYGLYGNFDFNLHTANFSALPGYLSCCPRFETGTGFGYNFGILTIIPLAESWELGLRLGYADLSGKLTRTEDIPAVYNPQTKQSVAGEFEHTVDSKIASVGLTPLLSYRMSDQFRLHAGFRAGYIMTKTFSQKEEITNPGFGTFIDNGVDTKSRIRNKYDDLDIPEASSIDAALVLGASYDLPLNDACTWFLSPEAFFTFGITSVGKDPWTINTLNGGFALKYAPREIIPPTPPPPPPPPPPLPPPPPPPLVPVLDASITAVSIDENGAESTITRIRTEEFLSRSINPLLNYVFFDDNNAELPGRYVRMKSSEKEGFSDKFLENLSTLQVYHQILNIVGNRMKKFPQTDLLLVGCNTNDGNEKGNMELSRKRAENVKDFIVNEWGIDPARITVQYKNLPATPSNITDPDGIEENRRVEMTSKWDELFAPLIIRDTIRTSNPPRLRFKPKVNAEIGISKWRVITFQSDNELKVFSGEGNPPSQLELDLSKEQKYVPTLDVPFKYKLEVVDNDNKKWESPTQELPVESYTIENKFLKLMDGQKVDEREYNQFRFISFPYNKADLVNEHKPIINSAKRVLKDNKTVVTIKGYTDRMGEDDINQKLSQRRAETVAKALGVDVKNAKGLGESILLYNNDLPEGRFYSRTVVVDIINIITEEDLQ